MRALTALIACVHGQMRFTFKRGSTCPTIPHDFIWSAPVYSLGISPFNEGDIMASSDWVPVVRKSIKPASFSPSGAAYTGDTSDIRSQSLPGFDIDFMEWHGLAKSVLHAISRYTSTVGKLKSYVVGRQATPNLPDVISAIRSRAEISSSGATCMTTVLTVRSETFPGLLRNMSLRDRTAGVHSVAIDIVDPILD